MADSSGSEEFYDAEDITPIKGSKRSSLNKSTSVIEDADNRDREKSLPKTDEATEPVASTSGHGMEETLNSVEDDQITVKNVVQDRRRFQELRRCMQTEDDDDIPEPAPSEHEPSFNMEHPFKIIAHDTMSLQSMTSLGRIGRILSGVTDSQPITCETPAKVSISSREPSTKSDDPLPNERSQNVISSVLVEPDVIASTKANSLKQCRSASGGISTISGCASVPAPVAPPRRKRRNKLYGSQSLSTADGDNLSICTNDTDDYYCGRMSERSDKPPALESLLDQASYSTSMCGNQSLALSPASTIESLTREFRDSLELTHSKYESVERVNAEVGSAVSSRSSTGTSSKSRGSRPDRDHAHRDSLSRSLLREGRAAASAPHSYKNPSPSSSSRSRRRSAGDEQISTQHRPRASNATDIKLTDMEILEQVTVLNLDTGERMPLSAAEHKIPQCINPLSLHIMRLTSEYIETDEHNTSPEPIRKSSWRSRINSISASTFNLTRWSKDRSKIVRNSISVQSIDSALNRETDEESESVCGGGIEDDAKEAKQQNNDKQTSAAIKKKTEKLKRLLGSTVRRTVEAAKSLAHEVSAARHKEDVADIADDVHHLHNIKLKASNSHKGPYDFDGCVRHVQEMGDAHSGAVWCCKLSVCGRLLATAGQDKLLRIWVTRDSYSFFHELRTKYNMEKKSSPSPSPSSPPSPPPSAPPGPPGAPGPALSAAAPFCPQPFCVYSGHTSDLLDVSWSKNFFILSSSMDKTVRLWHISRGECLCCFQHIDFVTAIVFHPRDDRYFLSGSLDGKLRLWNILDKKVAVWNEVDGKAKLITAANFCQNGKFAVVGTYDGRCIFYTTDRLKYHTQIDVRSTRGKNSTGRKISGIEPMPNDDKILVTSNDSRIRLYDLRDLNVSCKYKGYVNVSSQIKASFSHDGKYIVSGSENQCIYIWKTYHDYSKFTSVRRDRNDFWEGIKAHNAVVTCAVFAPNPDHFIRMIAEREAEAKMADGDAASTAQDDDVKGGEESMVSSSQTGHVLVSADFSGCIKVFVHKAKPKHSSLPASALA